MKKIVFILGTGHCGSTLLDLLLGSHTKAASLGEIYTVLKKDLDIPLCDICADDCNVWTPEVRKQLKSCYHPTILQRLISKIDFNKTIEANFYTQIAKQINQPILIDSSKNPGWIYRNGLKLSKGDKFEPVLVYLSRDGRAVVNSYYRKYPEKGLYHLSHNWNARIEKINQCYTNWDFAKKVHIRYEDLALQPVKTIQRVLQVCDMQYEPNMMRFWEHEHHTVNGNAGTKSMILKFQKEHLHKDWIEENKKGYYKNHELGIKFDERWKRELSDKELDQVEKIISISNNRILSKNYDIQKK